MRRSLARWSIEVRRWLSFGLVLLIPLALILVWTSVAPALTVATLASVARPTFSAAGHHSLAIKSDGSRWAWGNNYTRQLGDGTDTARHVPTKMGNEIGWAVVASGFDYNLGIKSDGSLWAWGSDVYGELGDGPEDSWPYFPIRVGTEANWVAVDTQGSHALALKSDGSLWAWGRNQNGQLGDGTTTDRAAPTRIGTATDWVAISAGAGHSLALKADGSLWAWGNNSWFELGDGTQKSRSVPARVGTATGWVFVEASMARSYAIKSDGSLWAWGGNQEGALGDGSTVIYRSTPTRIGTGTKWRSIAADGSSCLALQSDGSLWSWGDNGEGQLGDGSTTSRNVPARVGTGTNWVAVAAGPMHSLALQSDGSLWGWGNNWDGQVGDGTTTDRHSPVQVLTGVKLPPSGGGSTTSTTKPASTTTTRPSSTTTTHGGGGATSFSDVPANYPYREAIANMASLGVIGGYDDGTFGPEKLVLRKHFAKMIVGAMGLSVSESDWSDANPPFTDCGPDDPNSTYPHDYIAVAKANGLTSGKTATTFAPNANITRAQMMTMVVRAAQNFGISLDPVGLDYEGGVFQNYNDSNHGANVKLAEYNGLLEGIVYNQAAESWIAGNATRGEVAQMLWNLRQKMGSTGSTTTTTTTLPFNQPLFSDDFSTKAGGWPEASDANRTLTCDTSLSRYVITLSRANWLAWGWLTTSYSNFTVEVDALSLPYGLPGMYGLIFRVSSDGKNMYQFVVSNEGYWEVWRVTNGTRTSLGQVQSNPSTAINQGTAWNHLKVVADGTTIRMYVNGVSVCILSNASLTSGAIGFIGGSTTSSGVQLGFDNFEIWPPEL